MYINVHHIFKLLKQVATRVNRSRVKSHSSIARSTASSWVSCEPCEPWFRREHGNTLTPGSWSSLTFLDIRDHLSSSLVLPCPFYESLKEVLMIFFSPSILFPKPQNPKGIQKGSWQILILLLSLFAVWFVLIQMHRSVLLEPDMRCCEIKWNGPPMLRNLYVSSCWMANSKSSIAAACRGHIVSKFAKFYKYPGAKSANAALSLELVLKATIKLSNYIKFSWARKVLHWKWYRCVQCCSCKQVYSLTLLGWNLPLCGFKRSLKAVLAAVICLIERDVMTCLRDMFHAVSKRCFKTCF